MHRVQDHRHAMRGAAALWFRRCWDIVECLDTPGSTEQTHTMGLVAGITTVGSKCLLQATSGLQLICFGKQLHTEKGLGPRSTIYQTTSAETSTWSIVTCFKQEGWCGLSPVSVVVCNQPFLVEIIQGSKFEGLQNNWGSQGHPSCPTSDGLVITW